MDSVIRLISENQAQREDGTWEISPTFREVFCKVQSINRAEFFGAGRNGLNPAFRFDVFAAEYQGETIVEYQGETYSIYRTHQSDANTYVGPNLRRRQELMLDYVELYVEKKSGTVGFPTEMLTDAGSGSQTEQEPGEGAENVEP